MTDEEVMRQAADQLAAEVPGLLELAVAAPVELDPVFHLSEHYEVSAWLRWYYLFPPYPNQLLIVSGV